MTRRFLLCRADYYYFAGDDQAHMETVADQLNAQPSPWPGFPRYHVAEVPVLPEGTVVYPGYHFAYQQDGQIETGFMPEPCLEAPAFRYSMCGTPEACSVVSAEDARAQLLEALS